jgi:hypothetical protein
MLEGKGELIVYRGKSGSQVQLHAVDGTVWLTYRGMADLYGTTSENIIQIVKRILSDGELDEATTNSELVVQTEGTRQVRRRITVYNLDMILAVGYRVTTRQAVLFRQWATTVLKEYLVKGFALDDERLKNPDGQPDYFDELISRIRSIRASEKRFYQKVRDLFAASSSDYDKSSVTAQRFFATIQNKLLFAVTGHTAAELVRARINPDSASFGLTSWKGDRPVKADAIIAKNYLSTEEITELELLTTQFLDFAEGQARRRIATTMEQWVTVTDRLLDANSYPILRHLGQASHQEIESLVNDYWPQFNRACKQQEYNESWQIESADISKLLEIEQDHKRGDAGTTA